MADEKETTEEETEDQESEESTEDAEAAEEETEESEEESAEESEEEGAAEEESSNNDLDLDAEIAKERKGKPNAAIAREAIKERKAKREGGEAEDDADEDKPLTKRELKQILADERKDRTRDSAYTIARSISSSDKEAELITLKWQNRAFPDELSLREQVEEAYAITHRKKLLGERNEAMRALKGRKRLETKPSTAHRDAPSKPNGAKKVNGAEAQAFTAAGMTLNSKTGFWEKKLRNGDMLIRGRDGKTTLQKAKK